MNRANFHILIGLCVVIGLAAVVFLAAGSRSGDADQDGMALFAHFGTAQGVGPGTEIVLSGIPIGEVTGLEYDQSREQARVRMVVEPPVPLPYDSVAMIVTDGLLGDKYIKIEPGGSLDNLGDGDTFEYIQDSVDLQGILRKVVENAEAKRAAAKAAAEAGDEDEGENTETTP